MFDLKKDKERVVRSVKISFGDLLELEKDDVYVVLSEPDTFDCLRIKGRSKEEYSNPTFLMTYFKEVFPKYLTDHNLLSDGEKASNDEVLDFILRKDIIAETVASAYFEAVFLSPQNKTKGK